MPNSQFHTAISAPRFNRYLAACGNNKKRAEKLYRANLHLCQKLYAVIGIFEIVLRNSIDRHFISLKGNNWLEDAVDVGGYLDSTGCEESFHAVHEAIFKLGMEYTHDRLVAKLSFGFWVYQFAPKQYAAAGNTLMNIFSDRPFGTKQKDILKKLNGINEIRNRIAHYEPICFDSAAGTISTAKAQRRYDTLIELFTWLGCTPKRLLYGIDGVQKTIDEVNSV